MSSVIEKREVVKEPQADLGDAAKLSEVAKRTQAALMENQDTIVRSVIMARAARQLRDRLTTGIMGDFRDLMNTVYGFKTDRPNAKNREPYNDDVLRDCIVQVLIRGLRPIGNEFNIIAGNVYITKEGYSRMLREFPGFSNLLRKIGNARMHAEGAVVDCSATWMMNGIEQSMDCTGLYGIPVKRNESMGIDAILGKAESKLLRRIYSQLVGSDLLPPDEDEITTSSGEEMVTALKAGGFEEVK